MHKVFLASVLALSTAASAQSYGFGSSVDSFVDSGAVVDNIDEVIIVTDLDFAITSVVLVPAGSTVNIDGWASASFNVATASLSASASGTNASVSGSLVAAVGPNGSSFASANGSASNHNQTVSVSVSDSFSTLDTSVNLDAYGVPAGNAIEVIVPDFDLGALDFYGLTIDG